MPSPPPASTLRGGVPVNLNFTAGPESMQSAIEQCAIRTVVSSRVFLAKAKIGGISRWDWRGILDGSGDKMLYQLGDLAGDELPFAQLKKHALINSAARAADAALDFSQRIRAGRPGFTWLSGRSASRMATRC